MKKRHRGQALARKAESPSPVHPKVRVGGEEPHITRGWSLQCLLSPASFSPRSAEEFSSRAQPVARPPPLSRGTRSPHPSPPPICTSCSLLLRLLSLFTGALGAVPQRNLTAAPPAKTCPSHNCLLGLAARRPGRKGPQIRLSNQKLPSQSPTQTQTTHCENSYVGGSHKSVKY